MHNFSKTIAVFICLSAITVACKKVTRENQDFVGEWYGASGACNITVSIPSEGKGRYYKLCDSLSLYVESKGIPYLKSKNKVLKIGKKEFQVNSAPAEVLDSVNYVWKMTLDGVIYQKF